MESRHDDAHRSVARFQESALPVPISQSQLQPRVRRVCRKGALAWHGLRRPHAMAPVEAPAPRPQAAAGGTVRARGPPARISTRLNRKRVLSTFWDCALAEF